MVANVISWLRKLGLYQDNGNEDVPLTIEDVVKNIIEEIQLMDTIPKKPAYSMGKLKQNVLRKEQQWDIFCKSKVKELKKKLDPNFLLDNNGMLRKVVNLKYTVELTIVVPRKHISYYFRVSQHKRTPGYQLHCQYDEMLLLVDRHVQRHPSAYQQLQNYVDSFFPTGYLPSKCTWKYLKYHLPVEPWTALGPCRQYQKAIGMH